MPKLLAVFNTCGIAGNENSDHYIRAIRSLRSQDFDLDVVISSCLNNAYTRQRLLDSFKGKVSFNFIDESLPVNVTFNHSVLEYVKRFGQCDGYLYLDSGVHFENQPDAVSALYDAYKSGDYGMMVGRTHTDCGYDTNFGVANDNDLFTGPIFDIPVGKAVNNHWLIFSNKLLAYYGKLLPDIFASFCTESVSSFINAALKLKYGIYRDVIVEHVNKMDGQSAGFRPDKFQLETGRSYIDHAFKVDSILAIVGSKEAIKCGMGYEEMQNVVLHDKSQYDESGFCKNDKLKEFIRDNIFLSKDIFDYNQVKATFI